MDPLIIDASLYLGTHVGLNKKEKLYNVLNGNVTQMCNAFQIFLGSPQMLDQVRVIDKDDIRLCREFIDDYDCRLFVHHPYVSNFASNRTALSLKRLEYEIVAMKTIAPNRSGVVIHPGSASCRLEDKKKKANRNDRNTCINHIINSLNGMSDRRYILLENCAGEGNKLCKDLEEISMFARAMPDIRFCIDTAHSFGSGLCRFDTKETTFKFFDDFDRVVGLKRLGCIHLNDSKVPFESHKDQHERIGRGYIWSNNKQGLEELLSIAKHNKIPLIGEGSIEIVEDIPYLRSIILNGPLDHK
jgi:apurinic endonuclease APN1